MKIIAVLLCAVLLFSVGCAYNKSTVARVAGKGVSVMVGGVGPIKGDEVNAIISRQVNVTFERDREFVIEEKMTDKSQSATVRIIPRSVYTTGTYTTGG